MKQVFLLEQYPMVTLVVKDLISDIYQQAEVHSSTELAGNLASFDLAFADLYCPIPEQYQLVEKLCSLMAGKPVIVMTGEPSETLRSLVQLNDGLVLDRRMAYRECLFEIQRFANTNQNLNRLNDIRNEFQSEVHFPGAEKPLTLKQSEIMSMCANGVACKDIALTLNLSPETVRAHIRAAYARLGANCRAEAIRNYLVAKRLAERIC